MDALAIGDLRHCLTIQQLLSPSPDNTGFVGSVYEDVASIDGSICPLSEREMNLGRTVGSTATHKITIRYYDLLASAQRGTIRIKYGNRIFTINEIINAEERNYRLDLKVTEAHRT